jgi:hypothetical protein
MSEFYEETIENPDQYEFQKEFSGGPFFLSVVFATTETNRVAANCEIRVGTKLVAKAMTSNYRNEPSPSPQTLCAVVPSGSTVRITFAAGIGYKSIVAYQIK